MRAAQRADAADRALEILVAGREARDEDDERLAAVQDGKVALDPPDPFDTNIVAAVNQHQHRDKGFGPALGPEAGRRAVRSFERVGYHVLPGVLHQSTNAAHEVTFQLDEGEASIGALALGEKVQVSYEELASGTLVATAVAYPGATTTSANATSSSVPAGAAPPPPPPPPGH